jgi:hypothetical protein
MSRNLNDFLRDFSLLMDKYHLHTIYFDNDITITPDDIKNIVNGALEGKKEDLERIHIAKEYFEYYSDMINDKLNDRRNWQYYYPEPEPGEADPEIDPYTADTQMLEIMRRILNDLNKPTQELFEVMTPNEMMAMTSISRQMPRKMTEDIKKYTEEFIGKTPNGGKRKTINKGKSTNKTKTKKRKTKRRKTTRKKLNKRK